MKMRQHIINILALCFIFGFASNDLKASHVAGGNLYYTCLGDNQYEVTLEFRRDCFNNLPLAIFDDPASIGIFDGNGNLLTALEGGQFFINFNASDTLNEVLTTACQIQGDDVCVATTTYTKVVTLPFNPDGYILAYQRCCRNITLNNIVDPLLAGSTYWTEISPEAQLECNSTPRFNDWPDIFICVNEPLVFDHSATDLDGDSLVYRLCTPSVGASVDEPGPQPPNPPPFDVVSFQPPYSLTDLLGGTPLEIDPNTGIITATPNLVGQFLIGVCVEEYRNGELIGFTRRDFEYNVRICDPRPVVDLISPEDSNCEGLTGSFEVAVEPDDASYEWFVITENDTLYFPASPTFDYTFPETGTYTLGVHAVLDGEGCVDTAFHEYYVQQFDFENIEIKAPDLICGDTLQFGVSAEPDATFEWYSDSALTNSLGTGSPISLAFDGGTQTYYVVQTNSICPEVDSIVVEEFEAMADVDVFPSNLICENREYSIQLLNTNIPTPYEIQWEAQGGILITNQGEENATFQFAEAGMYNVILTFVDSNNCTFEFAYPVEVFEYEPEVSVVTASSTELCVGEEFMVSVMNNDISSPIALQWITDGTLQTGQGGPNAIIGFDQAGMYMVALIITDGDGCTKEYSWEIDVQQGPEIDLDNNVFVCFGESLELNPSGNPDYIYEWSTSNPDWSIDASAVNPILENVMGSGVVTVTVYVAGNEDCAVNEEILIAAGEEIEMEIEGQTSFCMFADLNLEATANQNGSYTWTNVNTGEEFQGSVLQAMVEENTQFELSFISINGCPFDTVVSIMAQQSFDLQIESSTGDVFCDGELVVLTANYNGMGMVTWTDENGVVLGQGDELQINPTGSITITATIEEGDCLEGDQITLNPTTGGFNLVYDEIICEARTVCIQVTGEGYQDCVASIPGFPDVFPDPNTGLLCIDVGESVSGIVTVTSLDGCLYELAFNITNGAIEGFEAFADPELINLEESTQLSTNGNDTWTYQWSPEGTLDDATSPEPIATPIDQNALYTVTVTNDLGCTATAEVSIEVRLPQCNSDDVFVPNLFTPNGDGLNDVFKVESNFVEEMTLMIYDRWGEKVFETNVVGSGWDGKYNGKELSPDVYGYCLNVRCINDVEYVTQGNVTLMK